MVTKRLCLRASRQIDILSEKTWGRSSRCSSKEDCMANPTPESLLSSAGLPFQKKVYPPPFSTSCPSSAKRVSERAAIEMLYLASSFEIRAVLLSGRLELGLSSRDLTFQQASVSGCCLSLCLGVHFSAVAAILIFVFLPQR